MTTTKDNPNISPQEEGAQSGSASPQSTVTGKYFWAARKNHQLGDWAATFGVIQNPWVPSPTVGARFTHQTLHRDLRNYTPTKTQFKLPHAESERTDAWFQETFRHLFWATYNFSVRRFGQQDYHEAASRSPWRDAELSDQFRDYASQLSRQDTLLGGWDLLLADKAHRACLVTGILSKVLTNCVFADLLWGATYEQKELLKAHDRATISDDGYKRTKRRAQMVRDVIGDRILTRDFWPKVDELATQTAALVLPLLNFQGQQAPKQKWPGLVVIYQELHDIISEAAYFSVCIRLSETIFQIEYPDPGDRWDLDYDELENKHIYLKSKENAQKYDASQESKGNNLPVRVAKVKVVAWPLIKRHKPLGSVEGYGAENGERIALVSMGKVAYYSGRSDDSGEMRERKPSLAEHLQAFEKQARHTRRTILFVTLLVLGVVIATAVRAESRLSARLPPLRLPWYQASYFLSDRGLF